MISYFPVVTGSLSVSGSVNISGGITASGGITISGSIASASFASTASFVALAQSASNAVSAATASFANTLTVAGNLTAQTLVVQTITSSVDFVTGSTRFGSLLANTHVFTGSMSVSGSANFSSGSDVTLSKITTPVGLEYQVRNTNGASGNHVFKSFNTAILTLDGGTNVATFASSITAGGNITTPGSLVSNITNGYGLLLNRAAVGNYNGISLQTANVAQWFVGMRENLSSNNYIIYNENGTDALTISKSSNNATFLAAVRAANFGLERAGSFRGGLYTYDAVTGTGTDYGVTIFAEGGTNNGNIYFCPNGSVTRVMTINTSSNVLINTVSSIAPGGITYRLEVNGPAHMTELSLGDSYNRSVSTDSSWSSFQTIIPVNTLEVYAVYLITASYTVNGSPYNVVTSFTFVTPNCNGGSADNEFLPICSTHQGGTGTMSFRAVAASSQQSGGLQVKFNGFGNLNGTLVLRATRLKRNIG